MSVENYEAEIRKAREERDRYRAALIALNHEIEQTLGAALRYPRYCDSPDTFPGATEADGVCVGDHVAESLADEAARVIERYRAALNWLESATLADTWGLAAVAPNGSGGWQEIALINNDNEVVVTAPTIIEAIAKTRAMEGE